MAEQQKEHTIFTIEKILANKKNDERIKINVMQLRMIEEHYQRNKVPNATTYTNIAKEVGLDEKYLKVTN